MGVLQRKLCLLDFAIYHVVGEYLLPPADNKAPWIEDLLP